MPVPSVPLVAWSVLSKFRIQDLKKNFKFPPSQPWTRAQHSLVSLTLGALIPILQIKFVPNLNMSFPYTLKDLLAKHLHDLGHEVDEAEPVLLSGVHPGVKRVGCVIFNLYSSKEMKLW